MTNKKFNLIKGGWLILLCVGILLLSPNLSQALPIPINVINIRAEGPSAGTPYLTQYWLNTVEFGELDAFCVENSPISGDLYELVIVPGTLSTVAGYASRYFDGTVFGLPDITTSEQAKVATQLAIWQTLGIATTTNAFYSDRVSEIIALLDTSILASVYLAQSPRGGSLGPSQDYLVSVPDASIMWLLGPAFIMLGLLGRKKSKEYLQIHC